jgi:hypothetical protein
LYLESKGPSICPPAVWSGCCCALLTGFCALLTGCFLDPKASPTCNTTETCLSDMLFGTCLAQWTAAFSPQQAVRLGPTKARQPSAAATTVAC